MNVRYCLRGWCVFVGICGAFAQTARIQGRVTTEDARPIANARLLYSRIRNFIQTRDGSRQAAPGEAYVNAQTLTQPDGTFNISNLPAGDYLLCAEADGFLSACQWFDPAAVRLSAGQTAQAAPIRLKRGVPVTIRVNDPLRVLDEAGMPSIPLALGVMSGIRFIGAHQVSSDAAGRTLSVLVPPDTPLKLWIHSWKAKLADELGAALNVAGAAIPFAVAAAAGSRAFTFTVQGQR